MALDSRLINEIHRLARGEKWPVRKVARHLKLSRQTVSKYLQRPWSPPAPRVRASKLDPFKPLIGQLLEKDPQASAVVIAQRLRPQGYGGGLSILRAWLRQARPRRRPSPAFVRVETGPGEACQADWGHFGSLDYQGDKRKLYAFACTECHSRLLWLQFTHSQSFEAFARCHLAAFRFMKGVPRDILYDNLLTAVLEHDGRLVRFNPRFLDFARLCGFYPRACNPSAPWEKGKVERALGYVRKNFWPLREFSGLADVNRQARAWLGEVANRRLHAETRQSPQERFQPRALQPLPELLPDCRETVSAHVGKDLRLHFDGNRYCLPARWAGRRLTVKADSQSVGIYDKNRQIVCYPRCWRRGQTLGAERFEKELLESRPSARRSRSQRRLADLLGSRAEQYLSSLAAAGRPLRREISQLLELVRRYGPDAASQAMGQAAAGQAFGADYVAHILRREHQDRRPQPPVPLKDRSLAELAPDPLSLLDYDAFILLERKKKKP